MQRFHEKTRELPIHFVHLRGPDHHPYGTAAIAMDGELRHVGVCIWNRRQAFSKEVARNVAAGRARKRASRGADCDDLCSATFSEAECDALFAHIISVVDRAGRGLKFQELIRILTHEARKDSDA